MLGFEHTLDEILQIPDYACSRIFRFIEFGRRASVCAQPNLLPARRFPTSACSWRANSPQGTVSESARIATAARFTVRPLHFGAPGPPMNANGLWKISPR